MHRQRVLIMTMVLAQAPTPIPVSPTTNPTIYGGGYGGSGGYLNPQSYVGLAHELGPAWFALFFFALLLFLACAYMIWRSWKQPSNAHQLAYLRAMYKLSNERHRQWQAAIRQLCTILGAIAKKEGIDLNGKLDDLRNAITSPPPMPDELLTILGNDAMRKGDDR